MPESAAAPKKKSFLTGLLGSGKSYWVFALVFALAAVGGVLTILGNAAATTTYYVLNADVASRTQITEDMLFPVKTSLGGQPPNALDIVDIREANAAGGEGAYALVAMDAGDVVSSSTVGPLNRISKSLPAGFVAASFSLTPDNAVAGKVRTGDYIDVTAVDDTNPENAVAKTVLHHVLVLDVTNDPTSIEEAANGGPAGAGVNTAESAAVHSGIPSLYVVGLTPADAAKLALVRDKNLMVTLAANDTTGSLDAQVSIGDVLTPGAVGDSGAGTKQDTAAPTK